MSYANGTPFLNLAQTVGSDHRDWFDENEAKLDLDTKMKTLWDGASSTAAILEQLQETVSTLDTNLASLTTTVNGHTTTLQTVNESLVLINSALAALNTDVNTKFDSAGIADPYDPTYGIYAVGDVVTYNGQRYRCVTAVSAAEPFDADKWAAEDIQTVIDGINTSLADKLSNINSGSNISVAATGYVGGSNKHVDVYTNIPIKPGSITVTLNSGNIYAADGTLHALTAGSISASRTSTGTLAISIPENLINNYTTLGYHAMVQFNGTITYNVA